MATLAPDKPQFRTEPRAYDALVAHLKEHPETAERIERAIRQNAGLIAGQILDGADAGEGGAAESRAGFTEGDGSVTPLSGGAARRGRR